MSQELETMSFKFLSCSNMFIVYNFCVKLTASVCHILKSKVYTLCVYNYTGENTNMECQNGVKVGTIFTLFKV